jgi:NarL family two-component system response regulator LiaR
MSNVRILIVDDKPLVRKGIRMFLELEEGLTVCGEAADGLEGIKKAFDLKPDVVLLDGRISMVSKLHNLSAKVRRMRKF